MENPLQKNQTTYSTNTEEEQATEDDGKILSISEISEILGLEPKTVRRYLYRGIITTKESDVRAWLQSRTYKRERPRRITHTSVFKKWRR